MDNLDRCWRVCSRRVLRVNNRTHCNILPQLMNVMKPSMQMTSRILTFYLQGFNNESDFVSFYFKNCFNCKESIMYRNLIFIAFKLDINVNILTNLTINEFKRKLRAYSLNDFSWKASLIKELLCIKEGDLFTHLTSDEVNFIIDSLCLN